MSTWVEIRPYEESDLDAIVEFSLRAWQPVFESLRQVLGDAIFMRLHFCWASARECHPTEPTAPTDRQQSAASGLECR